MKRPEYASPSRGGQTVRRASALIELTAVLFCVGLLLGLVPPSLESVIGKSRRSLCLDRLRAIGQASLIYSDRDVFNAAIPIHRRQFCQCPGQSCEGFCSTPIYIGAYEWGGKSGIGRDTFLTGASDPTGLNSKYGTKAGFGPGTRPLNDILYPGGFPDAWSGGRFDRQQGHADTKLPLDRYRCPADDGPPRGAHCPDWIVKPERSSYDHYGNSYAANVFMIGFGGSDNEMLSNSPYMRPHSRVPHPARTIYYEENIGRWAWAARRERDECFWIGKGVDPGPTKGLRGWHGKDWTYNRAFGDAHAETQTVFIEGSADSDGYANHYRSEQLSFYPDRECCAPTDLDCKFTKGGTHEGFQCVMIRGDGWQKDTLPAPFICTGLIHSGAGRPSYEDCVWSD